MIDWAEIVSEAQRNPGALESIIVILPPVAKGIGDRKWLATLFDDKKVSTK